MHRKKSEIIRANCTEKKRSQMCKEEKMNNLMDTYLKFTEKKIKKYMKAIFSSYYNEEFVSEYLKTYINARYYNVQNTEKPARAFYLRILDELNFKEDTLMKRCEEEAQTLDEKQNKLNLIHCINEVFGYILFFDNVRNIENFKTIDSLKEIIEKIAEIVDSTLDIKMAQEIEDKLYKEIKDDMLEKDIFLDKFSTDEFMLEFESTKFDEDTYFVNMTYDVKMPMQYSDSAIEKVYTEGIVAEDKLQIEYILLSTIAIRDIINGNFKDSYIAEFTTSLFKKKQKLEGILSLLGNEALQDKISLNISYEDYIKNQKSVLEYTKKGYNFTITLDDTIKNIEDVEKLKMFKLVIAPENMHLYKEIKSNKTILKNVVCE